MLRITQTDTKQAMKDTRRLISNILQLQEKMNRMVLSYNMEYWMKLDLTIDQLKSLIIIHSRGRISFRDLAQALGITRSNITGIADRLVQNGLVTRNHNLEGDRRLQYLMLTEKGIDILQNIRQEVFSEGVRILEALTVEDLIALEQGLSAMLRSAENHLQGRPRERVAARRNLVSPV